MSAPTSLLLFGPQETSWTLRDLESLQKKLQDRRSLEYLKNAIENLPSLELIFKRDLGINEPCGEPFGALLQLRDFAAGRIDLKTWSGALSNTQQASLTLVCHIIEFIDWASSCDAVSDLPSFEDAQGFCIGFLSAAAVASATTWKELERNAVCALRLAACIGAIVDAEAATNLKATAVHVKWKAHSQREFLDALVQETTDAYVSCWTDDTAATVTVPKDYEASFRKQLSESKILNQLIGLEGRFHSSIHEDIATRLQKACATTDDLRLPRVETVRIPLRSTADTEVIKTGWLSDIAVDVSLCKCAHWFQTVKEAIQQRVDSNRPIHFVPIGRSARVPTSVRASTSSSLPTPRPAEEIAVIGLGCRFPQSDDAKSFWGVIESGSSAISEVPRERFDPSHVSRGPKLPKYYGNFLREPAAFDHRFFGISGREAKSMDPQQRLALQVAYEAVESSGYYSRPEIRRERDVGVYLGVGAVDYEANVAGEDAGAFSATGTLRAFISGRINHFFGWSGPSITFDTACSSSAVAIHSACKALLAKECAMAVAGGVNVITSPSLHQNLAAASFLNPEGSSKAFDASANGYCRGEGAGLLVLKPLSCALADDDLIMGVISGSAVNQGSNSSPITVPHADSLRALYQKALATGNIDPAEVTYVEAHGTGTQVGDPIEYESVGSTFTTPGRRNELFLGSVKDSIGHTEAASGVAGVIKTLLMMSHRIIPRQANFKALNPSMAFPHGDLIKVPTTNNKWAPGNSGGLVALVNNYGAAGSNAAIVLRQHIGADNSRKALSPKHTYPILLAAQTHKSLMAYLGSLKLLEVVDGGNPDKLVVSELAPAINRRSNPSFEYRLALQAHNAESWSAAINSAVVPLTKTQLTPQKPVVLCFGGQTGKRPRISRDLYESCALFRRHLDACADTCAELNMEQLLPGMLDQQQVKDGDDIVALQCCLFMQQYASAMTWLDCGLQVDAIIGHSFGQLTALCVAGSLSLRDAVYFIAGRARLMRDAWQGEPGTMLSVECDPDWFKTTVELLNNEHDTRLSVACYNGPCSFVAAGDTATVSRLEEALRIERPDQGASQNLASKVKTTRLQSSHAFHSHLTDSILPALEDLAKSIEIRSPRIYIETCSEDGPWTKFDASELVQHTRRPVFFHDAVRRLEDRLGRGAIWLEAGCNTPVIPMTRRIVSLDKGNTLLPVDNLGGDGAAQNVADITCKLWMAGKDRHDWCSHSTFPEHSDATCRAVLSSPPYQFDTAEHWIQYKAPGSGVQQHVLASKLLPPSEPPLIQHCKEEDDGSLFAVNTESQIFQLAARGHAVAGQSLCPASMYCELATRCCAALHGNDTVDLAKSLLPHIQDLTMSAPLGLSPDSSVWLRLSRSGVSREEFAFAIFSRSTRGIDTEHATGTVSMLPLEDKSTESRIRLLRRLARDPSRAAKLLSSHHGGVSGNMVYRVFNDVVTYADYYSGVQKVTSSYNESAGRVSLPALAAFPLQNREFRDAIALDNFLQVAGIHVNCLSERQNGCVFMCVKVDDVLFTPEYVRNMNQAKQHSWVVHSRFDAVEEHSSKGPTTIINNIFVYDETSKNLVVGIIGALFQKVPFKSVMRNLARLSEPGSESSGLTRLETQDKNIHQSDSGYQTSAPLSPSDEPAPPSPPLSRSGETARHSEENANQPQVLDRLRDMIANIIEMPMEEVLPTSRLDTLGIDSLLVSEVTTEIEKRFGVSIGRDTVLGCESVSDLTCCIFPAREVNDRPTRDANGKQGKLHDPSQVASDNRPKAGSRGNETEYSSSSTGGPNAAISNIAKAFAKVEGRYDEIARDTGFAGFYTHVYPLQAELVVLYIVEAFASLGCDLRGMATGALVPTIKTLPTHNKLVPQLYRILERSGLIQQSPGSQEFHRTPQGIPETSASSRCEALLSLFPQHANETKLLATTGPHLAECLSGTKDPIDLIFGTAAARLLLENVYANAPMFLSGTHQLCRFLYQVLTSAADSGGREQVRILEIGAGTGGTTRYLLEALAASRSGVDVAYTFTDISASLVAAAKRKFAKYTTRSGFHMDFSILDLEAETIPQWALDKFDIVVSTNCVHATRDLARSTSNINSMLRPDHEAMLCLIELMPTDLYWFDLVFGLLEGWWMFDDGRSYALANEEHWERTLRDVGFAWVRWTNSASRESSVLKIITASRHEITADIEASVSILTKVTNKETVVFKKIDDLELNADIYYPEQEVKVSKPLPIALMIHGGGHVMLARNDVRPEQVQWLLRDGFLPVSIDYRLCPETNLSSGPIADVADALVWARKTLPRLKRLGRADVVPDGNRVVAIGWSTGGMLALSLGWIKLCLPPDAILAMYCPSDYEDPFWRRPNRPAGSDGSAATDCEDYALDQATISACSGRPIAGYTVSSTTHGQSAIGGWLAPWDPRSRLALHMNWHGRTLDVLLNGVDALSNQGANPLERDTAPFRLEAVRDISPLARVRCDDFAPVPTFLIHPSEDDLIPVAQAERMYTALKARGIQAQLRVVEGQKHLFDVYPRWKADRAAFDAVTEGYSFLKAMVSQ